MEFFYECKSFCVDFHKRTDTLPKRWRYIPLKISKGFLLCLGKYRLALTW